LPAKLVAEETEVKTRISRMLTNLRRRDRVQAVIAAGESGVVQPA
jgi:DNA-binding NarL/FixJ family response regulator